MAGKSSRSLPLPKDHGDAVDEELAEAEDVEDAAPRGESVDQEGGFSISKSCSKRKLILVFHLVGGSAAQLLEDFMFAERLTLSRDVRESAIAEEFAPLILVGGLFQESASPSRARNGAERVVLDAECVVQESESLNCCTQVIRSLLSFIIISGKQNAEEGEASEYVTRHIPGSNVKLTEDPEYVSKL